MDTDWIVTALECYEKPLLRYAAWLVDDVERAKDVVQETFLRLCKEKRESIGSHLPQWLFTVCRNLAIDLRKKDGRTEKLEDDEVAAAAVPSFEDKELLDQVLKLVEVLPKNQREIVYLRFQCGFSYKEISEVTRLSAGTVDFLIHTAIDGIRRRIESKHPVNVKNNRRSHEV